MNHQEKEVRKAIALLEAFVKEQQTVIDQAKKYLDRSIFYQLHFELKPQYQHVDFDLSIRAQKALRELKINTPCELINFCNQHGLEGLARMSRIGQKSYTEIKEFLKEICY